MRTIIEGKVYLIQQEADVIPAIRATVPVGTLDYTDDAMFVGEAVYGFDALPKVYPFILVGEYHENGIFSHVSVTGFDKSAFEDEA